MLFASILNLLVILGNYLQQTTSAEDISDEFFLGALRVNYHLKICLILYENISFELILFLAIKVGNMF